MGEKFTGSTRTCEEARYRGVCRDEYNSEAANTAAAMRMMYHLRRQRTERKSRSESGSAG